MPLLKRLIPYLSVMALLGLSACNTAARQQEIEVRRSFKNFVFSIDEKNMEGLYLSVYFPGVKDYKKHINDLLFQYLENLHGGKNIEFDEQGVVLSRFLGMVHHSYSIEEMERLSETDLRVRMKFQFAYDNLLKRAEYEPGTVVYIPGKPLGHAYRIEIDGDVPVPREQLKSLEVVSEFKRTNHQGFWQLRVCKVDPDTVEWETSIESDFSL